MRKAWIFLLAMALVWAAPVWAGGGKDKVAAAGKDEGTTAAAPAKARKSSVGPETAAVSAELAQLQKLIQAQAKQLAAQQKQIEALQHEVSARAATASATAAPAAIAATSPAPAAGDAAMAPASAATPVGVESPTAAPAKTVGVSSSSASASQAPGKLPEAIELAGGKIKLGFTVYGDWGMYFKTGYGPQFTTQVFPPGPGNDNYNSFDITRTYLNFFYSPNDKYTLRVTPNLFREVGNIPPQTIGKNAAQGATAPGSLVVRIKYAYVDMNKLFANSSAFGSDVLTLGQQTNPLIDWEEALYGYRFTSLVPWNYLSLSSTHAGVKLHGPIKMNGKNIFDYEVGAFDSGSFHNLELASEKQVMGRLSFYPMGAKGRFGGLGLTGFVDYGYQNVTPDSTNHELYRVATLVHYTNDTVGIAGEWDYGLNAFGVGNLFSGSGPPEAFGLVPVPPSEGAGLAAEAKSILNFQAQQQGFDFFGHVNIPHSPVSIFGLFQYFQPNTNVSNDPLDFERIVAGIAFKYNSHLRFAIDSQNLIYTHSQFTFNGIPNAVPTNSNALFANFEVNY